MLYPFKYAVEKADLVARFPFLQPVQILVGVAAEDKSRREVQAVGLEEGALPRPAQHSLQRDRVSSGLSP